MSETQTNELSSRYSPQEVETKTYKFWEEGGYFKSQDQSTKPPYSIILPPPNVTGTLHLGHALDHTIQDVLIRWKRMSGFNAMWLPGTDHAGIATQSVVERELKKEKKTRKELGREKFVEKVWEWKHKSGNTIVEQMKRLGDSCDWDRLRFTLDDGVSEAVKKVFVSLYKEGLIYRGVRLVNWDTQYETAVSDLEVESKSEKGTLWHIKYPIENSTEFVTVATTRPETMLGDTAVCVHPNDDRYKNIIGKNVILPLLNKKIKVIADDYVDKEFGSGVVKITPAHDFNDYEIGKRHKLEFINILNTNGTLNEKAGSYKGLSTKEARKKVLEDLTQQGLLVKEEPHQNTIPVSERSGTVIEPFLSQQWFVAIQKLATPAQNVVASGTTVFEPEQWTKTYLHWMGNIQDWCISRQLWWGHRIPAWNCTACKHVTVSETDPAECEKCKSKNISQEEDVLDTWFSSGLWPFSTMGWPENTETQKTFYPTDVLVTGHDIIFFWVARMMMLGLHFKKDVPFRTVYIHGLVRDAQGRKMSKSVGNTVDPLEMIEKYGADSLRFTLMSQIAGGRDLKFSEQRLEGYRNFTNKIWNAARFSLAAFEGENITNSSKPVKTDLSLADQWITVKLSECIKSVNHNLEQMRFSDAASALYSFVWNDFCDWYLEFIKPIIYKTKGPEKTATLTVLAHTFNRALKLLHPFIPFITEEVYQKMPVKNAALIVDQYPTQANEKEWLSIGTKEAAQSLDLVRDVVTAIRNIRGENRISPAVEITVRLAPADETTQKILGENKDFIIRLGKLKNCEIDPKGSLSKCAVAPVQSGGYQVDVVIPLEGLVDFEEEVARLEKHLEKNQKDINLLQSKLSNENFVKNAPEEVVAGDKEKLEVLLSQVKSIKMSLERFKG